LRALGKVKKGHKQVSPEGQIPMVAAEKKRGEKIKGRQFNEYKNNHNTNPY